MGEVRQKSECPELPITILQVDVQVGREKCPSAILLKNGSLSTPAGWTYSLLAVLAVSPSFLTSPFPYRVCLHLPYSQMLVSGSASEGTQTRTLG